MSDPSRDHARVSIVTGASSGIGRSTSLQLARRGHRLALAARTVEDLEEVAAECRDAGSPDVSVHRVDVAVDGDVERLVGETCRQHGRIDDVVHCAGLVTYGRLDDTSAEDFEQVVDTNLGGAAAVARHALPVLRRQGEGTLLLVGSLVGHLAVPDMSAYVISKWGVRALARQLKIENSDVSGVRIAYVVPGSVDTPIYERALEDGGQEPSPPPPVISSDQAARVVVGHLDGRGFTAHTSVVNRAMIAAFSLAPWLWDRTVGPAFRQLSHAPD